MSQSRTAVVVWTAILLVLCVAARGDAPKAEAVGELTLAELTREMQQQVERLRGWEFKHNVTAHLCGEEALRAFIRRNFDKSVEDGSLARKEAGARLVGLIPSDCNMLDTASAMFSVAAAFYDHDSGEVYVLQREGAALGSYMQRVSLLHELVHALDDQHLDIKRLHEAGEDSSDAGFVVGALLEGSAIIIQSTYMMQALTSSASDAEQMQKEMTEEMARQQAFFDAPPYFTMFTARFPCGSAFLRRGAGASFFHPPTPEAIGDALKRATEKLPSSSEQLLHPDKYWDAEKRDDPVVVDDASVEGIARAVGLKVIDTDTFGELLCAMLARPADQKPSQMAMMSPKTWTNEAATGWGGDRFFLLANMASAGPLDEPKGVWVTMWDTASDCSEFVAAYEEHRELAKRALVRAGDRCACWLFGLDEAEGAAFRERLTEEALNFRRAGHPWRCIEGS